MRDVALYSPASMGNIGYGFINVFWIRQCLKEYNNITLFTIEDKGLLEVLRSFKNISHDIILIIAGGEGDIKKETVYDMIQSEKINNRVHTFIRYFAEEEIMYYFYASDFVLVPHKGNHLAFSGPLSLAVEHCRPVIASDIGEIGSFVKNNDIGTLFLHDNWDDFADVTNRFKDSFDRYNTELFLEVQRANSWEDMSIRINNVYNSLKNGQ